MVQQDSQYPRFILKYDTQTANDATSCIYLNRIHLVNSEPFNHQIVLHQYSTHNTSYIHITVLKKWHHWKTKNMFKNICNALLTWQEIQIAMTQLEWFWLATTLCKLQFDWLINGSSCKLCFFFNQIEKLSILAYLSSFNYIQ